MANPSGRVYTMPWADPSKQGAYASSSGQQTVGGASSPGLTQATPMSSSGMTSQFDTDGLYSGMDTLANAFKQLDAGMGVAGIDPSKFNLNAGEFGDIYQDYLGNQPKSQAELGAGVPPTGNWYSRKVVDIVKKYVGVWYKWGGTNPKTGVDCSGLTQRVAKDAGYSIPRTASTQFNFFKQKGLLVNQKNAQAGDLVYYRSKNSPSGWHTGVYIGNGKMIDAPGKGRQVAVHNIWNSSLIMGFAHMPLTQPKKTVAQTQQSNQQTLR